MNTDIRLKLDIFEHPKVKKLSRRLGAEAVLSLLRLWLWAAANRPDGVLAAMDAEDVELAADWNGTEGALVAALTELRLLDVHEAGAREGGAQGAARAGAAALYVIHDWRAHQAWASAAEDRSKAARRAAQMRWNREESACPDARPVPREAFPAPACDEAATAQAPAPSQVAAAPSVPVPVVPALSEASPVPAASAAPGGLPYHEDSARAAEQSAAPADHAPPAEPYLKDRMPRAAEHAAPRASVAAPETLRQLAHAAPQHRPASGSQPAAPACDEAALSEGAPAIPDAPDAPRMRAQCGIMRPASTRIAPLKELKQEYPPIPLTGDTPQEGGHAPVPASPRSPTAAERAAQSAVLPAPNGGALGARPAAGAPPPKTQELRPEAAPALEIAAPAAPFPAGHALASQSAPVPAEPCAQPAPAGPALTPVPAPTVPHKGASPPAAPAVPARPEPPAPAAKGGASGSRRQRQRSRRAFQPPSVEQVAAYCRELESGISPQRFVEYYTAQGWFVGRAPMRDWRAAVRLWEQRDRDQARERLARGAACSPRGAVPQGGPSLGVIQRSRAVSVHQAQVQERDLMARLILDAEKHQQYQQDEAWLPAPALPLSGIPVSPCPVLTPELCAPAPCRAPPKPAARATEKRHAHP
ncbi:hypothetical protein [Mailhella sp.]|uniref:hypothetical protein n=1 Tax=Mailhella sp. TaxID=1981029 RepID=UPI00406488AC